MYINERRVSGSDADSILIGQMFSPAQFVGSMPVQHLEIMNRHCTNVSK